MENINLMDFISPELSLAVAAVYLTGVILKKYEGVKDKYIPFILCGLSIFLCLIYYLGTTTIVSAGDVFILIYNVIVQGLLITASAVFANQLIKQLKKKEE